MTCGFAVIPAAGLSLRLGSPKLALPWDAGTILEHVLAAWLASRVTRVSVVLRREDSALRKLCSRYDVDIELLPAPTADMKATVLAGLAGIQRRHAPAAQDAWLLAPADLPQIATSVMDQLLAEHERRPELIIVPDHEGRGGHPVLFPWPLAEAARWLPSGRGLNALVAAGPVLRLPCGPAAVPNDIDTLDDYARLKPGPHD